jgi:hypothetical protein
VSHQQPSPSRPRGRAQPRRPRPLPQGHALFTPGAAPARQVFEHRSAPSLLWLYQLPRWLLPLVSVGLLITGMAVAGLVGAIALGGVAILLGWLAALTWPRLAAGGRLVRLVAVSVVIAAAVLQGLR